LELEFHGNAAQVSTVTGGTETNVLVVRLFPAQPSSVTPNLILPPNNKSSHCIQIQAVGGWQ